MPTINDRASIAANTAAPTTTLFDLASDSSPKVRKALAKNPSTPTDVLIVLVSDEEWAVRFAVAQNPSPRALPVALEASDPDTRGRAAQRVDLDTAGMQLVLQDPVHTVRQRLAEVAEEPDVVAALARDPHPAVRASIVLNKTLSDADVEMLAQIRSPRSARQQLPLAGSALKRSPAWLTTALCRSDGQS